MVEDDFIPKNDALPDFGSNQGCIHPKSGSQPLSRFDPHNSDALMAELCSNQSSTWLHISRRQERFRLAPDNRANLLARMLSGHRRKLRSGVPIGGICIM